MGRENLSHLDTIKAMNLGAPASLPAISKPEALRLAGRDAGAPRAGSLEQKPRARSFAGRNDVGR